MTRTNNSGAWTRRLTLVLVFPLAMACGPEFDPFEQVQGLRVLGIAPDHPDLAPNEETVIRSLVHVEGDQGVSYSWDWCPFSGGAAEEYECALSQDDLDEMMAQAPFPIPVPELALGNTPEVPFRYPLPPELLQGICDAFLEEDIPDFVQLPECDDSFQIVLRLIVVNDDGDRVVAVKKMNLLFEAPADEAERNTNPSIAGVKVIKPGDTEEDAEELLEGEPMVLSKGKKHKILLDVGEDASQAYLAKTDDGGTKTRNENLIVTWYYEEGEMEYEGTGFIDGVLAFEDLRENTYTTPEDANDGEEVKLYFVIRDERKGVGWTTRTVSLE